MKRDNFDFLVKFCATQYQAFDALSWVPLPLVDAKLLAVAARFLSMTYWFGHDEVLTQVASTLDPGVTEPNSFIKEAAAMGFEFGRFSSALKMEISHHA